MSVTIRTTTFNNVDITINAVTMRDAMYELADAGLSILPAQGAPTGIVYEAAR